MELPLEGAGRRQALVIAAAAILAATCYFGAKGTVADYGVRSGDMRWTERATRLDPGDGEGWDHLGRLKQFDFDNPDPNAAIAAYLRAVKDDPNSAHYWMDLSGAYESAGDLRAARAALDHAKEVYPLSGEVAWNYGNFLLRQQDLKDGYAEIERAVRSDPSLLPLAISRAWRSTGDVNQLVNEVLPPENSAYFEALDYLASANEPDAAREVWQRLLRLDRPFQLKEAFPFIESLIYEDRADDAKRTWLEALKATGTSFDMPSGGSLVWNGDFAHDPLNGGLDWRWNPPIGVATEFEAAPVAHGMRAMRLDFAGGSNVELNEPFEFVPVEPNMAYRFHAFMHTESITTESGLRFIIFEANHPQAEKVITGNMTGTTPWTAEEADVHTGPDTHFIGIRIYRAQSRMFDNKLSGAAWIAEVTLKPRDAAAPQPQSAGGAGQAQ